MTSCSRLIPPFLVQGLVTSCGLTAYHKLPLARISAEDARGCVPLVCPITLLSRGRNHHATATPGSAPRPHANQCPDRSDAVYPRRCRYRHLALWPLCHLPALRLATGCCRSRVHGDRSGL